MSHSATYASEAETKGTYHSSCLMLSRNRVSGNAFLMKPPHKVVAQDKTGRPPTGQDPFSAIRLPPKLTAAIDKWTEENGVTSRSEAIRRLVELGLAASPLRRRNLEAASKALELAAQEIDKLLEPSIPEEERHRRKRRLLKGPKEFRDIRGDLSKQKS